MKNARSLALVLAALAAPLFPQNARAGVEATFDYFQEALSPFGEWIEVADYGLCWRPTGVAEDWAPYTDGYWAYTDAGWTWVSYEDWGGITYHYGRWIHLVDDGWVWVPKYEWGPAWVSWRSNDDYVGWAPLPPEARWEEDTGFSTWVDTSYDIGPDSYRFCHTRDFGAPVLAPVCLPWRENLVIIQNTVNITNITYNHDSSVVFCGGPNFVNINRHQHRPIPSLRLLREDREVRGNHGQRQPQVVRGNQLAVYAPKIARPADLKALPIRPRRVVGAEKINRGWSQVPNLAAQEQIKQRLRKQTEGLNPRTAPARPVRPVDLSNVPQKAQPNAPSPSVVTRDRNAPQRPVRQASEQPQRPVADGRPVLPRVPGNAAPPPVVARTRPSQDRPANVERPAQPRPGENRPSRVAERPAQVAVPAESARDDGGDRIHLQREQQQAAQQREENARSAAIARQQQEAAQRANEIRSRQAQQQNEQRAVAERPQRTAPPQRPQADTTNQQQAQVEARRQEALQQRQQMVARQQQENANRAAAVRQQQDAAQRNNQVRQQQEAVQRSNEMRQQQARQMEQRQVAQQANEMRAQQAQRAEMGRQRQEAVQQRANEMRQPQAPARQAQVQAPQRPQAAQPSRPAPQQSKDGDDDKRKQRAGR